MKTEKRMTVLYSKRMLLGASLIFAATNVMGAVDSSPVSHVDAVESILQQKEISGTVVDGSGEPVIGANVVVKGTTNGTITDLDGKFTLKVPAECVVVVSYIGYNSQEIRVTSSTIRLSVSLKEDSKTLDEVVVVGYGVQKKVNLSGSVSSINMDELTESRPITNVSHALAGMAAGVNVQSASNQPGNDDATIQVRGQGTLNDSAPLVIIDGVESSISSVSPQDIEAMSVLKDAASAAIYGSRAANGVILITTKQGKAGSMKIDYNGYVSFTSPTIPGTMDPVSNYADYMELINEGLYQSGQATVFSQAKIDEWRNAGGSDPLKYPNTNWLDDSFQNSVAHNHVLSMSGGSEKIRFYSSFGYQNNPGIMENTGFEKFSGRVNVTADIKPWLTLGAYVNGYVSNMDPAANYDKDDATTAVSEVFTYASATTPGMVFRSPDGRYGSVNNTEDASQAQTNNPLRRLNAVAGNIRKTNMRARFLGTLKPVEGLSITASYTYEFLDEYRSLKPVFFDLWNFYSNTITSPAGGDTWIRNYNGKTERFFGDVTARYETRFLKDRLGLTALVGASQERYRNHYFSAYKKDMIDLSLNTMDAAIGDATASGTSTEWAMRSFFGRINLDWESKYLLELNLRADQSSRFLSNNRTGYFPSASAAWRIDQEPFMANVVDKGLSNLKLRLSYGALGNNSVGNYDAISTYATSNYTVGNTLALGMAQIALANAGRTWETTYVTNVGVDFGFFNNRLTGTFDYFHKRTKDILIDLPAPIVHGTASIPKQNSATVTNKGIEFTLGWQDKVGDFSYGITGNFTYVKNMVDKYKGKDKGGMTISGANVIWEGHPINSQYLLQVDRIIQTDEDLAIVNEMLAKNPNAFDAFGVPEKGDFLYKDVDDNGIIDLNDRDIVSDGPNPKFQFGLNLNVAWKGIDFAVLFQGQAGGEAYWQNYLVNASTVRYGYQLNKEVCEGRWYEGRTDATYPRLLDYQDKRNTQNSDFYLENLSFLKIRNIQLGYTLPKAWMNKLTLDRIRVYASMENFFTFTSFRGFDPELGTSLAYPAMKNMVIGVNVTF